MSTFNTLSLDQEFEQLGFTLAQFRQIFRLCIETNLFNPFTKFRILYDELKQQNTRLENFIFKNMAIVDLELFDFSVNQKASFVLFQLIDIGSDNVEFNSKYCYGVCKFVHFLILYNEKYGQTKAVLELNTLWDSLELTPDQVKSITKS
jgi:hypothetical protein